MKKNGFTFVEVMVTIFVFSLIIASIFAIMTQGRISFHIGTTQVEVHQEIRKAVIWMNRELRQTRATEVRGVPSGGYNNTITFRIPQDTDGDGDVIDSDGNIEWSGDITYSLNNGQIIRTTSDQPLSVLANNISQLLFRRQNQTSNILEITVEARRRGLFGPEISANITTQVWLRN